jgi:hypothetical protein
MKQWNTGLPTAETAKKEQHQIHRPLLAAQWTSGTVLHDAER